MIKSITGTSTKPQKPERKYNYEVVTCSMQTSQIQIKKKVPKNPLKSNQKYARQLLWSEIKNSHKTAIKSLKNMDTVL